MDEGDVANDTAAKFLEGEIAHQKRMRKPELQAVGWCHYCSESVGSGKQFCDSDCRDGWEYEQQVKGHIYANR